MSDDEASVLDMLSSAQLAVEYTASMSQSEFEQDRKTQDAVLRRLTIIGEAARRVTDQYKEAHPQIEWSGPIRMRNKVTHGYDVVDLGLLWGVLQEDLPRLIAGLQPLSREVD